MEGKEQQGAPTSLIKDPSGETILVTIRIKKHELAECLRRIPKGGTLQDALYNAFSFGLFAIYRLASENRQLLDTLVDEWRSPYRRPNDARLIGRTDEDLIDEHFGLEGAGDGVSSAEALDVAVKATATASRQQQRRWVFVSAR